MTPESYPFYLPLLACWARKAALHQFIFEKKKKKAFVLFFLASNIFK